MKASKENLVEKSIQKQFFEYLTGNSSNPPDRSKGAYIYRQLVSYRFFEALKNAYPLLLQTVGEKIFRELVELFIKNKPASLYIWQSAFEFKSFILKNKMLSYFPSAKSIISYELTELELMMGNYKKIPDTIFSWNNRFRISPSVRLLKISYPIQRNDFKNKEKQLLIIYYDFQDHKVYYIESSEFMFVFLRSLNTDTILQSLEKTCELFRLDFSKTKKIIEPVLTSYCTKKILVATLPRQIL